VEIEGEFVVLMAGQSSIPNQLPTSPMRGICHYLHVISRRRAGTECPCCFCSN
jgi:hypothetical protein